MAPFRCRMCLYTYRIYIMDGIIFFCVCVCVYYYFLQNIARQPQTDTHARNILLPLLFAHHLQDEFQDLVTPHVLQKGHGKTSDQKTFCHEWIVRNV